MAIFTSSIGATGRDFASISSWNGSLPPTAAGDTYNGELYNDAEFVLTAEAAIGAAASGYAINLYPATGQGFRDHANKLTNPLRYDQTKGVGISTVTSDIRLLTTANALVTFSGLQLKVNAPDVYNNSYVLSLDNGATAKNCILHAVQGANRAILNLAHGSAATNCLILRQNSSAGDAVSMTATNNALRNSTVVRASDATTGATAIGSGYGSSTNIVKNCAVFGPWTTHFAAGTEFSAANSGYNATDAASGAPGSTGNVYSLTYANQFVGVAAAGLDFRAKAGSGLVAGVRDQTYTADLDIVGSARSITTPTIGAWEYAVASTPFNGAGLIANLRLRSVAATGAFGAVYRIIGTLVDPSTGAPRANLTAINAAFFDEATPSTLTTPKQVITNLTTDASGNLSWSLPSSALTLGQTGMFIAYHAGLGYLGAYRVALVA